MAETEQETIARILRTARTVATVGFSDRDKTKANYYAPAYLKGQGYTVIPVNPRLETGLNRPAYPSLLDVPEPIDVVQIYVRPDLVGPVVDQAIAIGAKAVWLSLGIVNEEAAAKARAAGLDVVMDHCMMVEHKYLNV